MKLVWKLRTANLLVRVRPALLIALGISLAAGSRPLFWLIVSVSVLHLTLWFMGMFRFDSGIFGPVVKGGQGPLVALTFDDGPNPEVTPLLLDLLAQYGAHATFFVIGENLKRRPELGRRILAEGHELACHTMTHKPLFVFLSYARKKQELVACMNEIKRLGGNPRYVRPPAGILHPDLFFLAEELGLELAGWTARAYDSAVKRSDVIVERIVSRIKPGGIIMLHDGSPSDKADRRPTLEAVRVILDYLQQESLAAVTLTDLMLRSRQVNA